jgi:hypothetical protein
VTIIRRKMLLIGRCEVDAVIALNSSYKNTNLLGRICNFIIFSDLRQ